MGKGSVYICEDCAKLCLSLIDIERRQREGKFPFGSEGEVSCDVTGEAHLLPPKP